MYTPPTLKIGYLFSLLHTTTLLFAAVCSGRNGAVALIDAGSLQRRRPSLIVNRKILGVSILPAGGDSASL
jgi:hypothetical protein